MQMQDNKRTNMYTLLPSNTQLQVGSLPVKVTGEFTKKREKQMTDKEKTIKCKSASSQARTRLVMAHKEEYNLYYQQELNKAGIQTRNQAMKEKYNYE